MEDIENLSEVAIVELLHMQMYYVNTLYALLLSIKETAPEELVTSIDTCLNSLLKSNFEGVA